MGYANDGSDDFEKLQIAFRQIVGKFGSVDDVLEAFGLKDLPSAQRYGIMFGFLVFICTISAVVGLLVLGGSFKRIAHQAETGQTTLMSAHDARAQRALLLEQLLEGRERMIQKYPKVERAEGYTPLTKSLMNVSPHKNYADVDGSEKKEISEVKDEKGSKGPSLYQQNYVKAYHICQDKPGGTLTVLE
jgi:hypothetical protein